MRTFVTALTCLWLAAPTLAAGLEWQQKRADLYPRSTDAFAVAEFRFTNTGPEAVRALAVQPDCGCVLAPLEKTSFAAGESGRIAATFVVGEQTGEHHVPIQVTWQSGGKVSTEVLVLHVTILPMVTFSQQFVYWRAGDARETRVVSVSLQAGEHLRIEAVVSENPDFDVEITPTNDTHRFALHVTPPREGARSLSRIKVITVPIAGGPPSTHILIARIL